MDTLEKLVDISNRLDHLENSAEWIARETVHTDNVVSQTATTLTALADDIRERICELVREMEEDFTGISCMH